MQGYKDFVKQVSVLQPLLNAYQRFRVFLYNKQNCEKTVRKPFGKRRDRVIYIIRRRHQAGFFSNFFYVLGHIIHADNNHWDIAVDMENYPTLYNEDHAVDNTENAWEYFFEQPSNICLHDAYHSAAQIHSSGFYLYDLVPYYEGTNRVFPTREIVAKLTPYMDQYIKIKPFIQEEAERVRSQWEGPVVGVHIRGTDMHTTPNHPVPPLLSQYFSALDSLISIAQIQYICLCTDEASILRQMQERYTDKIVFTDSFRSEDGQSIHKGHHSEERQNHRYLMGKEVLLDALVLSKCDHLICGHSNVPYAAIVLNKNQYQSIVLLENADQNKNMNQ